MTSFSIGWISDNSVTMCLNRSKEIQLEIMLFFVCCNIAVYDRKTPTL